MKMIVALMLFFGLITLSGCIGAAPRSYPISCHACAPHDPVHDLRPVILPPI
ncbi:hypothetical protein LSUCC0031_01125 [Rhodobacterales bacterium LSUCC0031]|nr:hypothetical protein [Rhodobacterales bacterium LSUCC0031]